MKFKRVKLFDCQDMPQDVRTKFFLSFNGGSNDICVKYFVDKESDVGKWLIANGAKNEEAVIIQHWW